MAGILPRHFVPEITSQATLFVTSSKLPVFDVVEVAFPHSPFDGMWKVVNDILNYLLPNIDNILLLKK